MKIVFHIILFVLFLVILLISSRVDSNRSSWGIILPTAVILYALSCLSSYLQQKWFPEKPSMVFSEDYTRALRISNEGNIQTAIVKPTISIKSFDIKDRKDHPQFDQQKFPYLYGLHFSFDVINGIEHKRDLVLTRVIAKLYCNNEADILNQAFDYNERIEMSSSKNIATIDGLFIGHPRKIENCKLQIICKFKNYPDVISQKVDALILKYKNDR